MKKRAHYSMVTLATVVTVSLFFSCNIFDSPGAPEKTEISSIFQGSDGEITEGFLLESVGKEIGIGAAIYLPDNFEAIIFKVVDSGTTVIDSTIRKFKEDYFKDTVWIRHTFYTPGLKNVTITPISNPDREPVTSKIIIEGTAQNAAPQWSVDTLRRTVKVGNQLSQSLVEICTDREKELITFTIIPETSDNGSITSSIYQFTPSQQHIGTQIVQIKASDPSGNNSILPLLITVLGSSGDPLPEYSITYDGNGSTGGTVPVDSNTYTASSTVLVKDNAGLLIKTGATFSGWNTAADGSGTTYASGATFSMGNANVILYARWTTQLPPFTVTYNGNLHTAGAAPVDTGKYETGATVTVKANTGNMVKVGYTFTGWNTAADGSRTTYAPGITFPMGSANITLYAQWTTAPTFTITYNGNGNTGGTVPSDANNYETAATVTVKENTGVLVKTGSTFTGWNTATDGSGTAYAPGVTFPMGSTNITLYAQWTANLTFTVTFNSNGGTGTMADQPIVSGMDAPLIANAFTKAGCTFTGWNTEMDGSGIPYAAGATFTMGDANITLFAQWKTNPSYNITFNNNGGSGVMATQSIVYGLTAKLTANTFTKPYSTFAGWAKTPTGAVEYLDNTDYTLEINEDITLYAVWTVNNVAPTVSALSITPNPVNQGTSVSFSATTNFGTAYPTAVYRIIKSPYTTAADTIASGTVSGTTISYSVAATYAHQISFKMVVRNSTATVESAPVALTVRDVTAPVVTLTGSAAVTVNQNSSWTDPGATAADDRDGTKTVVISGTVNLAVPGIYTVRYTATDNGGNSSYKERTVTVVAVWTQTDDFSTSSEISSAIFGAGEKVYFAQHLSYNIYLQTLNSNGIVTNVSSCASRYIDRLSIALGSDGSTIFIGCLTTLVSWNGTGWSYIDTTTTWYSVGGYFLQVGSANTPYVAAMEGFDLRIRKFNGVSWQIVGRDMSLPLNPNGPMNFCLTSTQTVFTIGTDWDNPGVSTANLENTTWNIVQVEATDTDRNSEQIISYGNNVYVGYTNENNANPSIYRWTSGAWTKLASMANSTTASGSLSIACSPSGELYAGHIEGSNVVIKKYSGSSWQNVPSSSNGTAFTVSSGNNIQVLPGTDKCYAFVRTATGLSIYMLPLQ